jgi:uncharacterized protein YndB with AHSA1/START domain
MNTDRIEKKIVLNSPRTRVWKALTNSNEFAEWFRLKLQDPFEVGKVIRGHVTHPGYEHLKVEMTIKRIEPEDLFSYSWHPYPIDPNVDYSKETPTLVEFRLQDVPEGTLLTVVESGFDQIPAARRDEAFRMNSDGWGAQLDNIQGYVAR